MMDWETTSVFIAAAIVFAILLYNVLGVSEKQQSELLESHTFLVRMEFT